MRKVGKVKEAHGLKGDLYILVFSKDISWVEDLEFFEVRSSSLNRNASEKTVKLEVEKIRPFKDGFIVKPKSFLSRNDSDLVKGYDFFIPQELLVSKEGEGIYLSEIIGFEMYDKIQGLVGSIEGVSSNGVQDILLVKKECAKNLVEVLFIDPFLERIDFENKKVFMNLPEGLIEVNEVASGENSNEFEDLGEDGDSSESSDSDESSG